MTLTRLLGRISPVADATMSIVLDQAQISAMQNRRMMTLPIARPIGDGGVSTISRAAGRNANSSLRRGVRRNGKGRGVGPPRADASADFMESPLQPMQRCVTATGLDQRIVASVLDKATAIEC